MPTGEAAALAGTPATRENDTKDQDRGPGSLAGNLTADPELRYTSSGRPVASLRVACSERVKNGDSGKWEDGPVSFFTVTAWGQLGEHLVEALQRGDRIVAEGRWTAQTWTDKDDQVQERIVLTARDCGPSMQFRAVRIDRTPRS
jgi:single-strand DNA-binding protein